MMSGRSRKKHDSVAGAKRTRNKKPTTLQLRISRRVECEGDLKSVRGETAKALLDRRWRKDMTQYIQYKLHQSATGRQLSLDRNNRGNQSISTGNESNRLSFQRQTEEREDHSTARKLIILVDEEENGEQKRIRSMCAAAPFNSLPRNSLTRRQAMVAYASWIIRQQSKRHNQHCFRFCCTDPL